MKRTPIFLPASSNGLRRPLVYSGKVGECTLTQSSSLPVSCAKGVPAAGHLSYCFLPLVFFSHLLPGAVGLDQAQESDKTVAGSDTNPEAHPERLLEAPKANPEAHPAEEHPARTNPEAHPEATPSSKLHTTTDANPDTNQAAPGSEKNRRVQNCRPLRDHVQQPGRWSARTALAASDVGSAQRQAGLRRISSHCARDADTRSHAADIG